VAAFATDSRNQPIKPQFQLRVDSAGGVASNAGDEPLERQGISQGLLEGSRDIRRVSDGNIQAERSVEKTYSTLIVDPVVAENVGLPGAAFAEGPEDDF
jgi:hypothetical protein